MVCEFKMFFFFLVILHFSLSSSVYSYQVVSDTDTNSNNNTNIDSDTDNTSVSGSSSNSYSSDEIRIEDLPIVALKGEVIPDRAICGDANYGDRVAFFPDIWWRMALLSPNPCGHVWEIKCIPDDINIDTCASVNSIIVTTVGSNGRTDVDQSVFTLAEIPFKRIAHPTASQITISLDVGVEDPDEN